MLFSVIFKKKKKSYYLLCSLFLSDNGDSGCWLNGDNKTSSFVVFEISFDLLLLLLLFSKLFGNTGNGVDKIGQTTRLLYIVSFVFDEVPHLKRVENLFLFYS